MLADGCRKPLVMASCWTTMVALAVVSLIMLLFLDSFVSVRNHLTEGPFSLSLIKSQRLISTPTAAVGSQAPGVDSWPQLSPVLYDEAYEDSLVNQLLQTQLVKPLECNMLLGIGVQKGGTTTLFECRQIVTWCSFVW
eukprot:m.218216 g.218216  ORF g.218216 m.218216 type:complete len:138 (+) comp17216_c1_seq4:185-598(+)